MNTLIINILYADVWQNSEKKIVFPALVWFITLYADHYGLIEYNFTDV